MATDKKFKILFFLLVWVAAVGCGITSYVSKALAPTDTPTPQNTPTLTLTPTPTPSPTPLPAVRVKQGDQALYFGNYEEAVNEYQLAFDTAPERAVQAAALVGIGRAYYQLTDYQHAIQSFITLVDYYPQDVSVPQAYYFLGQSYAAVNDHKQAAQAYSKYVEANPGVLDIYVQELRGDELAAADDLPAAVGAYELAVKAGQDEDTSEIEIKIGQAYAAQGNHEEAIRRYMQTYEKAGDDYTKAKVNLLVGQSYLAIGLPEQAYARFQDSAANYPRAYDSYSGVVALVDAGIPVDDMNRGLVDYFAGKYGLAVDAFDRYIAANPTHDGTAHHYKALCLVEEGNFERAIQEWKALSADHPEDRFFADAWDEISFTQWYHLNRYEAAADTLLSFVAKYPKQEQAPTFLFQAARIQERASLLEDAAATWARMIDEYPAADNSERGLFLAGITRYRLKDYQQALTLFQRLLVLTSDAETQAAASLWIGKIRQVQGDPQAAQEAWLAASQKSTTGYYSARARDLLDNKALFSDPRQYSLEYDLTKERYAAEEWLRMTFELPEDTNLSGLGALASDNRIKRGDAYWELGLYRKASAEFEAVQKEIEQYPAECYRLMNHMLDLGFYKPAILLSRQILDLAKMDDDSTLTAPRYYNHIRFGVYYRDFVLETAGKENLSTLFLLSVIRQESLFEGFAGSSAGAMGLMQLMPATAEDVANKLNWPANFTEADLYRPYINIPLGASYLTRMEGLFGKNLYKALAAYNAGPGVEAQQWSEMAGNDPDLYLEVVRYAETRNYILNIAEFMNIYRLLYGAAE